MITLSQGDYIDLLEICARHPIMPSMNDTSPPDSKPAETGLLRGRQLIADQIKRLPEKPGVYRMIDGEGGVLYVGKAKNLKKRVTSYARPTGHTNRIARMIAQTRDMEFVVTASETESLLLEANLIKQLKPQFNVLMRDDKSFPYILIATDHEIPQLLKHRGAQKRPGHYYGPFAYAGAVNRTLNILQKAFLLRSCEDSIYESRSRPCLLYEIKRCSAPCVGLISKADYQDLVDETKRFLAGKSREIQTALSQQMEQAARARHYERAATFRDRIKALATIQESQDINLTTFTDADVFAIHLEAGQACVQAFFYRVGQNWGNNAYYPQHSRDESAAEILDVFLAQFYANREPPKLVLVSESLPQQALLQQALNERAGRKVEISTPKRGDRRAVVEQAKMNAREALARRLAERSSQRKLLSAVADIFALSAPPRRMEVFDNSHISGTHAFGCMIVANEEGLVKNQYRKFAIKDPNTIAGDDYGMMREVLTRRYERLVREETPGSDKWPSMIIVDGGAGQLSVAKDVITQCGITIGTDIENGEVLLLSVGKGRREDGHGRKLADRRQGEVADQFFVPGRAPFTLPPRSPILYYLQNLRDEAHRFAIGSHRAKRRKQSFANPLDDIAGIGAKRKKALLHHFGSAKAVAKAKPEDLCAVDGISKALAQKIHDHLNG